MDKNKTKQMHVYALCNKIKSSGIVLDRQKDNTDNTSTVFNEKKKKKKKKVNQVCCVLNSKTRNIVQN